MIKMAEIALWKLRQARYNVGVKPVLATAPVRTADDGVIIFSMIGTRVLQPYLVAAKSLHQQLQRGRFAILNDGTLTADDRSVLRKHLNDPEIFDIASVDTGGCPKGGCWERLLTLMELRRNAYVIQLDSDTVTLGPVPEIQAAIEQGVSFTLKGEETSKLMPVDAFARTKSFVDLASPDTHVQDRAEVALPRLDWSWAGGNGQYIRGCAGFAGFAPGGFDISVVRAFSSAMGAELGKDVWSRWGSEQVMSNVIIANEPNPLMLPYERYLNFWNEPASDNAAFMHFIGTYRYHRGAYLDASARAIAALFASR